MTLCVPVSEVSEGETCDAIVGQNFASIEQNECGLGKDGPVFCNWSVDFSTEGDYLWMYSDLGEGGTYACRTARSTSRTTRSSTSATRPSPAS